MLSRFFIDRPIFATVIALVTVIAGGALVWVLPVAQYPEVVPPTVQVSAIYPGANATVVSNTVATPIEQEVNGVEGMIYMQSTSASDGSYNLTVTFEQGVDLDIASVLVQNRVAVATPRLPQEVTQQGVTTKKKSTSITMVISLTSPDDQYDSVFLGNYATIHLRDELSRVDGVGEVRVFGGADYSMRVWLDPNKLKARSLTTQDVVAAIREQNVQVAAGQIGQPPAPAGQNFQLTINTLGRLSDESQFENLIIKSEGDGRFTRVKDVARVELGAKDYNVATFETGRTATAILIYQLPDANALDVVANVRKAMDGLSEDFPQGMEHRYMVDSTEFVNASIKEVYLTLLQAIALVVVTIFVFLQDWRSTLIPVITIPVSLIGTFAVMALFGSSINMITLFGLVLAIGIVVDDAIVVVENTARLIEKGLSPRDAAVKAMEEVTGPVIATTLVLLAVFVPTAMLGGITGELYRQFSLTISAATVLSSINALTLSPAMCALLLRPSKGRPNLFFRGFNRVYGGTEWVYAGVVGVLVRRVSIGLLLFAALGVLTGWSFLQLPTGFLPVEDQGYLFCNIQLPDAASLERTEEVTRKIDKMLEETPGVRSWVTINGFSLLDSAIGSNSAAVFVRLEPWDDRTSPQLQQGAILGGLYQRFAAIQEAQILAFPRPSIDGLGSGTGFEMRLQDRGGLGLPTLSALTNEVVSDANAQSGLGRVNSTFRASVPQLFVDVDRDKVKRLDVPLSQVFDTLQTYLGSSYVNDFNKFGRTYQVRVQADHQFRVESDDIKQLDVRNAQGQMAPVGAFVDVEETVGPQLIQRYNLYPSAPITGEPAPGYSSGQALELMEQLVESKAPAGASYEWTGISYQEKQVGSERIVIFVLAIVFVFLVLAAQYESWTSPLAVVAVAPLAVLGAAAAIAVRGMDVNVYTQIGLVLLVALASKNAILIVEFASQLREEGNTIVESAREAARLRFRAILMTSFSFILGVVPLLIAAGAGAASRQAVGTAVFGGMIAATAFSVLFVPTFFVVMRSIAEIRSKQLGETLPNGQE
ncbi:Efflux pump membrane transporter BepE [Pseudobythopirellula maris]|uniref:Efflux pump membrane transporter BepE n=1 Tax=Pseudobythopirellula maris TaxID=2527991 RepID=A0A5C5ZT19_9BACT|nr:multidrug efflux RND transporter permease subunit [Pseudobythopirellula maris]TWT89931.1 Efflux pump membrane transporter BepE [Pseudobythopirellula maris]